MDRWMDGRTYVERDRQIDMQRDGLMDGWSDGRTDRQVGCRTIPPDNYPGQFTPGKFPQDNSFPILGRTFLPGQFPRFIMPTYILYMYAYTHIYIHTYVHTFTHIHTHIHIHTYT